MVYLNSRSGSRVDGAFLVARERQGDSAVNVPPAGGRVPGFLVQSALRALTELRIDHTTVDATLPSVCEGGSVSRTDFNALLARLARAHRRPALAVEAGKMSTESSMGLFGPVLVASRTLRSAAEHLERIQVAHFGAAIWRLQPVAGGALVQREPSQAPDGLLYFMLGMLAANLERFVGADRASATHIRVMGPPPAEEGAYRSAFAGRVRFGSEQTGMYFPADLLDRVRPGTDLTYAAALRDLAIRQVDTPRRDGVWSGRLEAALRSQADLANVDLHKVAAGWGVSVRTLRRRISAEGGRVAEIIEAVRFQRARTLLETTGLSIEDVANALGYSDASALARAFRRWAGASPAAYRARRPPDGSETIR